ncbi:MAG: putative molybdenum carrier protein [Burkholderiales bacterium]
MPLARIVSGGQTGVDRGALDAALEAGFPCGGWAPEGRAAEDGPIHERYPMRELAGAGYEERTLQNVLDSDGTAILHSGTLEGGTRQTMLHCVEHGKPFELIDAIHIGPRDAALKLSDFIARNRLAVLNIAGPRASKWPDAWHYAHSTVRHLLSSRGNGVILAQAGIQ